MRHKTINFGIVTLLLFAGCGVNQTKTRIVLAEGVLSVINLSDIDIFPSVHARQTEDFGGVSPLNFKVIGFAAIEIDQAVRVRWAERDWNAPQKEAAFQLRTTPEIAKQAKYFELCFAHDHKWVLNIFSSSVPNAKDLLVSVSGKECVPSRSAADPAP